MATFMGTLAVCLQLKLDQWEVPQEDQGRERNLGHLFPGSLAVESLRPKDICSVCSVALLTPFFLSLDLITTRALTALPDPSLEDRISQFHPLMVGWLPLGQTTGTVMQPPLTPSCNCEVPVLVVS